MIYDLCIDIITKLQKGSIPQNL